MKRVYICLTAIAAMLGAASCGNKAENTVLTNQQDTLSWVMGMSLAQTAKSGFYDFDEAVVRKAFESALKGEKQPIDANTYQMACEQIAFMAASQQRQNTEAQTQTGSKRQEAYFEQLLKEKPQLKKSDEGFYYEVLTPGHGPKATPGLRVSLNFASTNALTGDTIINTFTNEEPIKHVLAQNMFKGMYYGMQLMPAGSRYRFYFPYELCQNVRDIPAYTPVIYEVELYEIFKD